MPNSSYFHRMIFDLRERSTATRVIETALAVLIITTAFVGNILVCWTIYRHRMLKKIPNYYVCALTVSDILFAAFVFPFVLGVSATGHWPFSDTACQFQGYMSMWMAYVSILTITLTAINRFFKVIKPNLYPKYYTPKKTMASIVAVWIFAAVGALPHILRPGNRYIFHPGKMLCLFDLDKVSIVYTLMVAATYFGIPSAIIAVSYWKIFCFSRSQNNVFSSRKDSTTPSTLNRREINITRVLFAVLVAFFACYIQIAVIDMIETFYRQFAQPRQVYVMYTTLAGLASCLNPIIYGFMNPTFRKEFVKILCLKRLGINTLRQISSDSQTDQRINTIDKARRASEATQAYTNSLDKKKIGKMVVFAQPNHCCSVDSVAC